MFCFWLKLNQNNVLLDHNYNACLTDFGFASMVGDTSEVSVYLQMTTMKPGTLRWAAPEHFVADSEETSQATQPTTKSDIYSFGNLGLLVSAVSCTAYLFSYISFQVLSGQHPWSEIKNDMAVMYQLSRGNKPKRPSSPLIEDRQWELIERCWSSVDDRPCTEDVVSSLQQFLRSFPPPLPLLDMFRLLSHSSPPPQSAPAIPTSIYPEEKNTGTLEFDVQSPCLSEITPEPVVQDGKCMTTPDLISSHPLRHSERCHHT